MADQTAAEKAAAAKTAAAAGKGKKLVQYIGTSDVREIDKAAFKNIGIDQDKVAFSRANNWRMTDEGMSPDAVEYFDTQDESFVVTDVS